MRSKIFLVVLKLGFMVVTKSFSQDQSLTNYRPYFERELKGWTETIENFQLSSFKKIDTTPFEKREYGDLKRLQDFYSVYKPALTFSKDSNQFIDIYSYWLNLERRGDKIVYSGSEVDQAIWLCDLKGAKWTRILFFGPFERIQEVAWLTYDKFMLVGIRKDEKLRYN